MDWQVATLFPVPVFKVRLPFAERVKRFFEDHIQSITDTSVVDKQGALKHFYSNANVFSSLGDLNWLRTELEQTGTMIYSDLLNYKHSGDLNITNAWFNQCELGGSQPMHNHANCLLCGTFYLHADTNTKLLFDNPQNIPSQHAELYDCPDPGPNEHGLLFHRKQAQIDVRNGDCLFWPARLMHGYFDNPTPNRLTLSFNLMPSRLNMDYQTRTFY